MDKRKRIYAYYDGSNFYHCAKENYGIVNVNFFNMTNQLLDLQFEELVKIKYYNSPVNRQENPLAYAQQQKFFDALRRTPLLELNLGRLAKRPLKAVNVNCIKCGPSNVRMLTCPICKSSIDILTGYETKEKGIDVKIAISMLLDASHDKYDTALLFSADADFVPAIKYIIKTLNKEVIFCRFPYPKTSDLIQNCSSSRIITKDMMEKAQIGYTFKKQ